MAAQSIPKSVTALMTHDKSSRAAAARAGALERSDERVGDAESVELKAGAQVVIVDAPGWSGSVVATWREVVLTLDVAPTVDEVVGDADVGGYESETQDEIVDAPICVGGVVSTWLWTLETLETSLSSSFGRERASATTLALPCKY